MVTFTWNWLFKSYRVQLLFINFFIFVNFSPSSYNVKSGGSAFKRKYDSLEKVLFPIVSKVSYSVGSRLGSIWNMPLYRCIAMTP